MPKPSFMKNSRVNIQPIAGVGEDKIVPIFLKGISRKVNFIARHEFELAYYDVTILLISHYPTCFCLFLKHFFTHEN